MKNLLFVAIVLSVAFASCGKRINVNGDIGNRWEMLTTKKWYVASMEVNNAPKAPKDCEKDNYYVFAYSDQGRWEEGAMNCYATDTFITTNNEGDAMPTYTEFKWEMPGDQREIHIWDFGFKGSRREWLIENMDFTHLDVRSIENVNGKTYVYNIHLQGR
jgi:hypothetical protein